MKQLRLFKLIITLIILLLATLMTGCGKEAEPPAASASASPITSIAPTPAATAETAEYSNWILTDNFASRVNFRSSPEVTDSNLLGMIYDREPVVVLESPVKRADIEWAKIEYNGVIGYVSLSYITNEKPATILESFAEGIHLNDYVTGETMRSRLVQVEEVAPKVIIDLTLASEDNYVSQYAKSGGNTTVGALYDYPASMIQQRTGEKLAAAADTLEEAGYQLVLWDAYQPYYVSLQIYEIANNPAIMAYPEIGSDLNRGAGVDVTLYQNNQPVDMPTSDRLIGLGAYASNYPNHERLTLLSDAMTAAGFEATEAQWWHFTDPNWVYYPTLNYDLGLFKADE